MYRVASARIIWTNALSQSDLNPTDSDIYICMAGPHCIAGRWSDGHYWLITDDNKELMLNRNCSVVRFVPKLMTADFTTFMIGKSRKEIQRPSLNAMQHEDKQWRFWKFPRGSLITLRFWSASRFWVHCWWNKNSAFRDPSSDLSNAGVFFGWGRWKARYTYSRSHHSFSVALPITHSATFISLDIFETNDFAECCMFTARLSRIYSIIRAEERTYPWYPSKLGDSRRFVQRSQKTFNGSALREPVRVDLAQRVRLKHYLWPLRNPCLNYVSSVSTCFVYNVIQFEGLDTFEIATHLSV